MSGVSHDRDFPSFKPTFMYHYLRLSFEVYNSFLPYLAWKKWAIEVWSVNKEWHLPIKMEFLRNFWLWRNQDFDLIFSWHSHMGVFWQLKVQKWPEDSNYYLWDKNSVTVSLWATLWVHLPTFKSKSKEYWWKKMASSIAHRIFWPSKPFKFIQ